MVLTWTEIISHTCSLSRKTNTALTLFQLNSRTTTVWNRQRSWLILRASYIRYTKSRRPFLSKNLNLFKFKNDTCLRKQMQDVKTTFIRKVKRGPFSSTKLYSYLFSHTSCSKIYWQLTTSEKFRLSFYKMTILTNRILAIMKNHTYYQSFQTKYSFDY